MTNLSRACACMLLVLSAVPATAFAQEASDDGITISGNATVVSDYRFRGFSQSNEEAAIQGGFSIGHDSGLYVGTWGRASASRTAPRSTSSPAMRRRWRRG